MNAPAHISQDDREKAAFFRCSQTLRRLAHSYKRWALADEAEGRADDYRKHRSESTRLWQSAKWHLSMAKRRSK
jgi:hypothetical protein